MVRTDGLYSEGKGGIGGATSKGTLTLCIGSGVGHVLPPSVNVGRRSATTGGRGLDILDGRKPNEGL